jgi:hypothetical protein
MSLLLNLQHVLDSILGSYSTPVIEIIDPVFTKTSPKCLFCMTENERFGLVFTKTGPINSGTGIDFPPLSSKNLASGLLHYTECTLIVGGV